MKAPLPRSKRTARAPRSPLHAPRLFLALLAASLLTACKTATVTGEHTFASLPATKPNLIYVTDFDLGAQNIQHEPGLLPTGPGPVGRVAERLSGTPPDPAARARQLVDLMAESLVTDLTKAGFTATRLVPDSALPADGWLVRGAFTEVQEGNRLRRAVIGFGSGQTELQVVAVVDNLSQGPPKPLYEVDTQASSGSKPGAGPTLALVPYAAAARFVLAGHDLDQNVNQTAAQISAQIVQRIQQAKPSTP